MAAVPMLAGVGRMMVCCSSSSAMMMMMGGDEETPEDPTTTTPTEPSYPKGQYVKLQQTWAKALL